MAPPPVFGPINKEYKLFTRPDVDSLLALFCDNMASLIAILGVMANVVPSLVFGATEAHKEAFASMIWLRVCPGIAFALAFGNLWYAWMAAKLAGHEKRTDVTALPYGINTPAGFIAAWNIMLPIAGALYAANPAISPEEWATKTWQTACAANFIGGLFEICGAIIDIRPYIARAALWAPVSAVGFVWLALVPFVLVAKEPIIGFLPLALCFTGFFANRGKGIYTKFAGGGAALIAITGLILKWAGTGKYTGDQDFMGDQVRNAWDNFAGKNDMMQGYDSDGEKIPVFPLGYWSEVGSFVAVVFPVALQSFVETMENVEAAAAMGDSYNLREAMIVDGVGTCIGAFFGSVIPTTVYIGHKRHKVIGAHAGYSIMNAFIYFLILHLGLLPTIFYVLDEVSINVILLMVGLLICAQAVEVSHVRHMPAFFIGLMCLICDWATLDANATRIGIHNIAAGGGIMASLIIPAIICDLIDLRFLRAAAYAAAAAVFSEFGIMHGMNPVDTSERLPNAFPFFLSGGDGDMKVKGQLTASFKDGFEGHRASCSDPPEFRVDQMGADGKLAGGVNEGWRFSIAYTMVVVFCLLHYAAQKKGFIGPAIMDNGVSPGYKDEEYTEADKDKADKKSMEISSTA